MGKKNSIDLDVTSGASDGFDISGGTTKRKFTISGADIAIVGSGTNTYTFPPNTSTLASIGGTETLTNKTLTTPTIGDMTNMGHNHTSASQGGNFDYAGRNSADFTNATTTFTLVTGLSLTVAANEKWVFRYALSCNCNTGTAGLKVALAIPTSATIQAVVFGSTTALTANRNDILTAAGAVGGTTNGSSALVTVAGDGVVYIDGIIVNSSNAGTLDLLLLKVTANTAKIYANSILWARAIP